MAHPRLQHPLSRAVVALTATAALTTAAGAASWQPLSFTARDEHSAVLDPARDRVIVFGGSDGTRTLNDVWILDRTTAQWSRLPLAGPHRRGHAAVYDPVGDRMLVIGGESEAGRHFDVWSLALSGTPQWSLLATTGTLDRAVGHTAVYDSAYHRVVVFGGGDPGFPAITVRALQLTGTPQWVGLSPMAPWPPPRTNASAVYDPAGQRMIVFGGHSYAEGYLNDAWILTLGESPAWSAVSATGTPPPRRSGHVAVWDAPRSSMLVLGGEGGSGPWFESYSYRLSFAGTPRWSEMVATDWCPPRWTSTETASVIDHAREQWVVVGGRTETGRTANVWAQPLGLPIPRSLELHALAHAAATWDATRHRAVVLGGLDGHNTSSAAGWLDAPGFARWTPLPGDGKAAHTAVYDPLRDRVIAYGGMYAGIFCSADVVGGLGILALSPSPAWSYPPTSGPVPPDRAGHSAILDPVADRMIVFGGFTSSHEPSHLGDLWSLDLASLTWSAIPAIGGPPSPREGHTATYDPIGHRMIVAGGYEEFGFDDEVWALSLTPPYEWVLLGHLPAPRFEHTTVYDPVRHRLVVFGGQTASSGFVNDVWAMELGHPTLWTPIATTGVAPTPRLGHVAVYDAPNDRMLVYSGLRSANEVLNDVWSLPFGDVAAVEEAAELAGRVGFVTPSPTRGASRVRLTLPDPSIVRIAIHDVTGRVVRTFPAQPLGAGSHDLEWDARNQRGVAVAPGLYFYRVAIGDRTLARKVVVAR